MRKMPFVEHREGDGTHRAGGRADFDMVEQPMLEFVRLGVFAYSLCKQFAPLCRQEGCSLSILCLHFCHAIATAEVRCSHRLPADALEQAVAAAIRTDIMIRRNWIGSSFIATALS